MATRDSRERGWTVAALIAVPILIAIARTRNAAAAEVLQGGLAMGPGAQHVQQILFVPLSAVVVALFRLTLGVRVLGLFRPILLALAFHATGIGPGLVFLALSIAAIALVHPWLRGVHSFARLAIELTLVAALVIVGGTWQPGFISFPMVALCLTCEAFASRLRSRGAAEAFARTTATAIAASVIALVASVPGLFEWLVRHPEMLVAEVGAVLGIDGWLNLRLLTGAMDRLTWAPLRLMTVADAGSSD